MTEALQRYRFRTVLSCPLIALVLPAMASPAAAQDDRARAEDIVVTGRGLDPSPLLQAYSVVTLDAERSALSASGRLEDVLSGAAGFQQFRRSDSRSANPTAQGVTQRGLGGNASSRTLVVLDGVPVTDPFFGHVPFSALPAERLGRISVIRRSLLCPAGRAAGPDQCDPWRRNRGLRCRCGGRHG